VSRHATSATTDTAGRWAKLSAPRAAAAATTGLSVQAPNSSSNDMIKVVTVVQQIMTELSEAVSEKDKIMVITKAVTHHDCITCSLIALLHSAYVLMGSVSLFTTNSSAGSLNSNLGSEFSETCGFQILHNYIPVSVASKGILEDPVHRQHQDLILTRGQIESPCDELTTATMTCEDYDIETP
jgi:hypothetical protein